MKYSYINRFIVLSPVSDNEQRAVKIFSVIKKISHYLPNELAIVKSGDSLNNISAASILIYLNLINEKILKGIAEPVRFSSNNDKFNLFFGTEKNKNFTYDFIWFSLNPTFFNTPDKQKSEEFLTLLNDIYFEFEGLYAYTEDELLMTIYFSKESYQFANKNVPEELLEFLTKPNFKMIESFGLPSLKTPQSINQFKIPNGIWWINFFNKQQVEAIDKEKLCVAEPYKITKISESAYLFMLTEFKLDCNNSYHLEKLRHTLQIIRLEDLQKEFLLI